MSMHESPNERGVIPSAAYDLRQAAQSRASGALVLGGLAGLLGVVLWSGVAATSGAVREWFIVVVGLAVAVTVRVCVGRAVATSWLSVGVVLLGAGVGGAFMAACASQSVNPVLVFAHWGPVGASVLNEQVFSSRQLMYDALSAAVALVVLKSGPREQTAR